MAANTNAKQENVSGSVTSSYDVVVDTPYNIDIASFGQSHIDSASTMMTNNHICELQTSCVQGDSYFTLRCWLVKQKYTKP